MFSKTFKNIFMFLIEISLRKGSKNLYPYPY